MLNLFIQLKNISYHTSVPVIRPVMDYRELNQHVSGSIPDNSWQAKQTRGHLCVW